MEQRQPSLRFTFSMPVCISAIRLVEKVTRRRELAVAADETSLISILKMWQSQFESDSKTGVVAVKMELLAGIRCFALNIPNIAGKTLSCVSSNAKIIQ